MNLLGVSGTSAFPSHLTSGTNLTLKKFSIPPSQAKQLPARGGTLLDALTSELTQSEQRR